MTALATPRLYPLDLDLAGDRVAFVTLTEADYRAASFLDERLLLTPRDGATLAWTEVQEAVRSLKADCDFIFHVGHTGSTLLSRLLGTSERVFALREPAVLRTLARLEADGGAIAPRLEGFLRLWARVWRPGQKTLLKATSFASEIAPSLLGASPGARAIAMFVPPVAYVATLLAGPASRAALPIEAPHRLARLHRRLGGVFWRLASLSDGELAAMSWTCEIVSLARAAQDFGPHWLWLDFETFLDDPPRALKACLAHLHGQADEGAVAAMMAGPHLTRYSKAPEHPYDRDLRARVLAQSARDNAREIDRAIAWLNAAGAAHPLIADATHAAAAARAEFRLESERPFHNTAGKP